MSILLVSGFSGCSSTDDEPDDIPGYRLFNERDSAACCEIFKAFGGEYNSFYNVPHIRLDSIPTWNATRWTWYPDLNQYRITKLELRSKYGWGVGMLPECIGDLDSLTTLSIIGEEYCGAVPESICKLTKLYDLNILNTSFTSLPENLFNENMRYILICGNKDIRKIPYSVVNLRHQPPYGYNLYSNGFTGECPPIKKAIVDLHDNRFTSIDWECAITDTINVVPEDGDRFFAGAWLEGNLLQGEMPPYILEKLLQDTLAYRAFRFRVWQQKDGCAITGIHEGMEWEALFTEYKKNHPEYRWGNPYYKKPEPKSATESKSRFSVVGGPLQH